MSTFLTPDQLTAARATAASFLPDSCILKAGGGTIGSTGKQSGTPSTIGTYACRLDRPKHTAAAEKESQGAAQAIERYVLVLEHTTSVTEGMTATVNGVVYDIRGVQTGGAWQIQTRCDVVRAV